MNYITQSNAIRRFHEGVKVIGHDDPGVELIVRTIARDEFAHEDRRMSEICQRTGSVSCIQQLVKSCGELTVIKVPLLLSELIELLCGNDAMSVKPRVSQCVPLIEHLCWEGIRQP